MYALQSRWDQKDSPDMVTVMLQVFLFDVYALLDPKTTLYFMTPYDTMKFNVSPKILSVPFSFSTPVGESVLAKWIIEIAQSQFLKKSPQLI